jgi:hypothetical protein
VAEHKAQKAMPASLADDPKYWGDQADEARALAELMRDPHTKLAMLSARAIEQRSPNDHSVKWLLT